MRGLRGEAPFDGTRYPALPWGGRPVAERDITFISDWIDDGCPADDHSTTYPVSGKTTEPVLREIPATSQMSSIVVLSYPRSVNSSIAISATCAVIARRASCRAPGRAFG